MTPYPDPEPGSQQRFNVAHTRTTAWVEMTIGILRAWFQCLRKLRVTPERACNIILACVVLHNNASVRGEQHPAVHINGPEDDHVWMFRMEGSEVSFGGTTFQIKQPQSKKGKYLHI